MPLRNVIRNVRANGQRDHRRGVVYTPDPVARQLAAWAIRDTSDRVLDPCIGRGIFVAAACARLLALGAKSPEQNIFGVDCDSEATRAFRFAGGLKQNFREEDFFSVSRQDLVEDVSVVLANPPYLRHHDLRRASLTNARRAVRAAGYTLPGTANYWAYFVLHALQFLRSGGRLAFVLPGAMLHADFAAHVREVLYGQFASLEFITLNECIFDGVQEEAVLLLADGKVDGRDARATLEMRADSVGSLSLTGRRHSSSPRTSTVDRWSHLRLSDVEVQAYESFAKRASVVGDHFDVRIGAVTGAKTFFVRTQAEIDLLPSVCWRRAITRNRLLTGLVFTDDDWTDYAERDEPLLLADVGPPDLRSARVRAFLRKGLRLKVDRTSHARRRAFWYSIQIPEMPDAFLTCMTAVSPAIVVNNARVVPTNTIFGLYFRSQPESNVVASVAALAFATSLAQLGAEVEGRGYGGGLLKIEPSDARRIPLPTLSRPVAAETFQEADRLRRQRRFAELAELADCAFFDGDARRFLGPIRSALERLRRQRLGRAATRLGGVQLPDAARTSQARQVSANGFGGRG